MTLDTSGNTCHRQTVPNDQPGIWAKIRLSSEKKHNKHRTAWDSISGLFNAFPKVYHQAITLVCRFLGFYNYLQFSGKSENKYSTPGIEPGWQESKTKILTTELKANFSHWSRKCGYIHLSRGNPHRETKGMSFGLSRAHWPRLIPPKNISGPLGPPTPETSGSQRTPPS